MKIFSKWLDGLDDRIEALRLRWVGNIDLLIVLHGKGSIFIRFLVTPGKSYQRFSLTPRSRWVDFSSRLQRCVRYPIRSFTATAL